MQTAEEILNNIKDFTSLEIKSFFQPNLALTKGALYLGQNARCFWLFSVISSALNGAQDTSYKVNVNKDETGKVTTNIYDTNNAIVFQKEIQQIYFPFDAYQFYIKRKEENNKVFYLAHIETEIS